MLTFVAFWVVGMVYLVSIGTLSTTYNGPWASIEWSDTTKYMMLYWIFGGLWKFAFICAIT